MQNIESSFLIPRRFKSLNFYLIVSLVFGILSCSGGGSSDSNDQGETTSSSNNNIQASFASPLRIMPIGDSITESRRGYSSYRYWLWQQLLAAGFNVDFVGSKHGVFEGSPRRSDFDQDHEGHWGWRTDEVIATLVNSIPTYNPDIALIHLGTNDIFESQSIESTIFELAMIIDLLRAHNSSIKIILAQIIPSKSMANRLGQLNQEIAKLAASRQLPNSPLLLVDQWTGFNVSSDTFDGIHPNESGEQKLAGNWFNAIAEASLMSQ